jgi:hypothetical protein
MTALGPVPAPGPASHNIEALKRGRRCAIDRFGFFLAAGDTHSAEGLDGLPTLPKEPSPTASGVQEPSPSADTLAPSQSGAGLTESTVVVLEDIQAAREGAIEQAIQSRSTHHGVTWWEDIAKEVRREALHTGCALRSTHNSNGHGAGSPGTPHHHAADVASHDNSTPPASSSAQAEHSTAWARAALLRARRRIRRGPLPMEERRIAWQLLTGATFRPIFADEYNRLLERTIGQDSEEVMLRDLGRTLPLHCLFKDDESPGQRSLRRVLHAYCARDPEVGYCQGMGFIAAVLLLHMDESAAFGVLWQLMNGRHYLMRQLYQPGFPLLQKMLGILKGLLRRFLPRLHEHFTDLCIEPAFYASHWFLTLFAYQLPVPLVCRIWDLFISEGWRIVFKVAIALLAWEEPQLSTTTMEGALLLLKTIHEKKDPEAIIARAMAMPIKECDLRPEASDVPMQ